MADILWLQVGKLEVDLFSKKPHNICQHLQWKSDVEIAYHRSTIGVAAGYNYTGGRNWTQNINCKICLLLHFRKWHRL